MQTLADGDLLVVSLSTGEEILASLKDACAAHGIRAGFISGLGALSEVELAFFDPEKKEYLSRTFQETLEIGNLVGNISRMDDETFIHVHLTVAGPELLAFTGHLKRGIVGVACEIYIRKSTKEIKRIRDPEGGFNPLKLS